MEFNELKAIQDQLDKHIGETKNIDVKQYPTERIVALQVEFNELLNELPFLFKYWSRKYTDKHAIDWNKVLEEYVDGWHFILSIANDFGIEDYKRTKREFHDMRKLALGINNIISRLTKKDFNDLVDYYILFGEKLGLTKEQVVAAYMKKNEVNYERQAQGY